MSSRYDPILVQTADWLKFAEAKNGALIVFNSAVLAATMQQAFEHHPDNALVRLYLGSLWVLLGASLIIALFSFLPKTEIPLLSVSQRPSPSDNLIFFGAAKKYTADEYAAAVEARYGPGAPEDANWRKDISEQIVTNARIAVWKYSCFKVALWGTIWGLLTPILGPIAVAVLYTWSKAHRI